MKTTYVCYGLVLNSLLLFVGLLRDANELLFPSIFFAVEVILIALLFRNLFIERESEFFEKSKF
ncbi:MAG: hypothetical protein KJO04_11215 [Bacteroidia bacterium]|nr:hypothetical protein [Bacteroidia bacterium]